MKKILLSLGVIAIVAVGAIGATKAFFSSTATATGNVFTAGSLNLRVAQDSNGIPVNGWGTSQNASWNFSAMAPGGTPSISSIWLKNTGSINGTSLGITAANNETFGGFEKQARITELTLGGSNLLTGGAGATIGAYVAPTNCTVTVSGTKITTAISTSNTAGDVICVAPGDYNATWEGNITAIAVNKEVTIVSTQGPSVTSSIPFNVTAKNVTIRGFSISAPSGSYGVLVNDVNNVSILDNKIHDIGTTLSTGSAQAVYFVDGASAVSGFTVKGNTITNIGSLTITSTDSNKGIFIGDSNGASIISNVTIQNNIISNVHALATTKGAYGILVNIHSAAGYINGLIVKNNSISDLEGLWSHAIGLEGNTLNASVTLNDISNLVDHKSPSDAVGVKVEDNADASSVVINQNNLAQNVAFGIINSMGTAVNGQNNWWGDLIPADQISGSVNTFGFLSGAVAGLINGTDQNSNGYADLQDLRLTPLSNLAIGLNVGEQKQLIMGVQLDGPTTGDGYQNASLTTIMTIILNQ